MQLVELKRGLIMKKALFILPLMFLVACSSISESESEGSSSSSSEDNPPIPPEKDLFYLSDLESFEEETLTHSVDNGVSVAKASISAEYLQYGVSVSINVEDSNISTYSDLGYSDNIEIQIQAFDSSYQLNNKTYDFLLNAAGNYWLNRWNRGYKVCSLTNADFSYHYETTAKGYSGGFFLSFEALGIPARKAVGSVRLFFAVRNRASESINVYQECDTLGSTYNEPNTWFVLNGNNKFIRKDTHSFALGSEHSDVLNNLASISTDLDHHNVFPGAPMFQASNLGLAEYGLADELLNNSSYIRGTKAGPVTATATSSGHVVAAVNADNATLNNALISDGWNLMQDNCPDIATYTASNSHDYNQLVNYYSKSVSANDSISISGEWAILFAKKDQTLPELDFYSSETYISSTAVNDVFYLEDSQECSVGPNIVRSQSGRLFCLWTTGGPYEPHEYNYWYICYSDDNGKTWVRAAIWDTWVDQVVKGTKKAVIFESNLNVTDDNELYMFYTLRENINGGQSPSCLQGYVKVSNIEKSPDTWVLSEPHVIGTGFFAKNTYRVLSDGTYMVCFQSDMDERYLLVYISKDKGTTWEYYSNVYAPQAFSYDEPIIMEKDDGTLWMTLRTRKQYMYQSFSKDGGKNWSIATKYFMPNTDTRFCIKELANGSWIMAYNNSQSGRTNMTIALSNDEGKSWHNKIILYPGFCSYPDLQIDENEIHVVFDDGRYKQYQWRTENDGKTKTWGYIYHYSFKYEELFNSSLHTIDVTDLDVVTRCRERGIETLQGDGTESNPYLINNILDWNLVSNQTNDTSGKGESFEGIYFKLTADLEGVDRKIGINVNPFAGTFDGDGHSITVDLVFGESVANQGCLFGRTSSRATIKNITSKGKMISQHTGESHMGGIVGINEGLIQNCNSYVDIEACGYQIGGIAGRMNGGSIINCNNYGKVKTSSTATGNFSRGIAGIVGYINVNAESVVDNCKNYGAIESSGTQVGGIVGFSNGSATYVHEISNCQNLGKISSTATINSTSNEGVAGIAGFVIHTKISGCTNDGDVTALSSEVAGIAGKVADASTIENCINNATIIGFDQVGGMGGRVVSSSTIKDCTNNGDIYYRDGSMHGQIYGYQNGATLSGNIEGGSISQYIEE